MVNNGVSVLPKPRQRGKGRSSGCSGSSSVPGCWLQTPGGWLGIAATPPLSHRSAEQGAPGTAALSAKSAEDPRKPLGVGRCDPASTCKGCKEGRSSGRGVVAVIIGVSPTELSEPGELGAGCHSWKGTSALPKDLLSMTWGVGASTQPHGSLWHPSAAHCSHGPPRPSPAALPPPLFLPVPWLSLPRVFLRVSCPLSSPPGINHPPAPASRRKQPPTLPPPSHGTCLPLEGWESVPRPEGVHSENLSGTV